MQVAVNLLKVDVLGLLVLCEVWDWEPWSGLFVATALSWEMMSVSCWG
jgi:hypothetical protein